MLRNYPLNDLIAKMNAARGTDKVEAIATVMQQLSKEESNVDHSEHHPEKE